MKRYIQLATVFFLVLLLQIQIVNLFWIIIKNTGIIKLLFQKYQIAINCGESAARQHPIPVEASTPIRRMPAP